MNREEAIKQFDEIASIFISMAKLTRGMSNSPEEVQNKIKRTYELQNYIKENLK